MRFRRILIGIVSLGLMMTTLTGCFKISADELYSLPQPSREFLKLQERINAVLAQGAEYSPPTAGPNRQSVQLKDLDGDGINEAIAFFSTKGDRPLKIYILKQSGDSYSVFDIIEGDGNAIESIRYADLDGDKISELIVGWQASATLLHMNIYSIKGGRHLSLADDDYTEITIGDMDLDGRQDVIALRLPSSELPGQADMFSLRSDGEMTMLSARLSKGIESFTHVLKGLLSDGTPALFVEAACSGTSVVTDILVWRTGSLFDVTLSLSSGVSEDTLRSYPVYSADINGDGVTEVPIPRLLPVADVNTKYYVIDWYTYLQYGYKNKIFTTYHDFSDGWYLILPDTWKNISVRRDDSVVGERTLIFSVRSALNAMPTDFLKIYTLSGDNKNDRAKLPERFVLQELGDTIYAAEILNDVDGTYLDKAKIAALFRLLYSDWTVGSVS